MKKNIGKEIQFVAHRITVGNPVTGILLKEDKTSIIVRLTKDIKGVVTTWGKGVERSFEKSMINEYKVL